MCKESIEYPSSNSERSGNCVTDQFSDTYTHRDNGFANSNPYGNYRVTFTYTDTNADRDPNSVTDRDNGFANSNSYSNSDDGDTKSYSDPVADDVEALSESGSKCDSNSCTTVAYTNSDDHRYSVEHSDSDTEPDCDEYTYS